MDKWLVSASSATRVDKGFPGRRPEMPDWRGLQGALPGDALNTRAGEAR